MTLKEFRDIWQGTTQKVCELFNVSDAYTQGSMDQRAFLMSIIADALNDILRLQSKGYQERLKDLFTPEEVSRLVRLAANDKQSMPCSACSRSPEKVGCLLCCNPDWHNYEPRRIVPQVTYSLPRSVRFTEEQARKLFNVPEDCPYEEPDSDTFVFTKKVVDTEPISYTVSEKESDSTTPRATETDKTESDKEGDSDAMWCL